MEDRNVVGDEVWQVARNDCLIERFFFPHDRVKIGLSNTVTEFLAAGYTFEHEKPERGALRKPHFDFRATGPALIQTPNFHVPNPMRKLLQRTLQAV